jgi:KilA-N domain
LPNNAKSKGMKKIEVHGLEIQIEKIKDEDYISLTDIAKESEKRAAVLISSWMKNSNTLLFLNAWEKLHNPDFKVHQMEYFRLQAAENRYIATPQNYIQETGAIGLISKSGRYGGTFAHKDIALNFCYWLSPVFQVYLLKEFQKLKEEEFSRKNLEWHLTKITHNIDEVRNLLDTIPGQREDLNRLNYLKGTDEK